MCGIYGKFGFSSGLNISDSISATHLLEHRGPDGYGFEYGDFKQGTQTVCHNVTPNSVDTDSANYFLGHRRLSIVDLSENAFQPMESACGRYSVIFNGEIYNYIELWNELLDYGCEFKTDHSDTEVILNAYDTWGTACLEKFRGMYAFALFDRHQQQVFIARDRIGQKSVYFELTDHAFTFSSELPSIVQFGQPRHLDLDALNLYLELGYVPYPHSIFEGIEKLPPASFGLIDLKSKNIEIHEYWDVLDDINANWDAENAREKVAGLLAESVKYRLRADVSAGAFISGGTDSTLVVKAISEVSATQLDIYGADFPGTDRSERKYIEEVAARYGQNLKLSDIDLSQIDNIGSIVAVFDEPFDGTSSIALFELFKEAAKDHKIILTGDGGDEMFAGYTRYATFPRKDRLIRFLQFLRFPSLVLQIVGRISKLPGKVKSLATYLEGDTFSNFNGLNSTEPFRDLLKGQYRRDGISVGSVFSRITARIREKRLPIVKALQYLEMKTILPGRMLYKLDRFSMAYSIEARSPFLDHELAEFAYSIPDNVNIRGKTTKAVLKDILSEDFDEAFVHRAKQGFGNPLSKWFAEAQPEEIFALLLDKNSEVFRYLDYELTHQALPEIKGPYVAGCEKSVWRVLVLAHYLESNRQYFKVAE